jgi:uncharacterized protein (TIGR00725 family)
MILAVIGGRHCSEEIYELAREVGREIARAGAILICGGMFGVMEAAGHGAKEAGGTRIGTLPGKAKTAANAFADIPIVTGQTVDFLMSHVLNSPESSATIF